MRALLLLVLAWPQLAAAQVVHDDFLLEHFSPQNWYVCRRPENVMTVVARPGGGRMAQLVAQPVKPRILGLEILETHEACIDEQGNYIPDGKQRAELWEKRELLQPFGTETWIQFEFMVAALPPGAEVVIGQLKADGGRKPMLAQRFARRSFTVTIGQDDDRYGKVEGCGVAVASDTRLPGRGCGLNITVDSRDRLPSPFDRWVRMTYRIRPGIENGLLEVWADGKLIAKAAGRIGYREAVGRMQYFKFGPYGDPAPGDTKAWLARYRRAPTCAQLGNPSAAECR